MCQLSYLDASEHKELNARVSRETGLLFHTASIRDVRSKLASLSDFTPAARGTFVSVFLAILGGRGFERLILGRSPVFEIALGAICACCCLRLLAAVTSPLTFWIWSWISAARSGLLLRECWNQPFAVAGRIAGSSGKLTSTE